MMSAPSRDDVTMRNSSSGRGKGGKEGSVEGGLMYWWWVCLLIRLFLYEVQHPVMLAVSLASGSRRLVGDYDLSSVKVCPFPPTCSAAIHGSEKSFNLQLHGFIEKP